MTFATAWKIAGACLIAFLAEIVLAYYLFANFAYELSPLGAARSTGAAPLETPLTVLARVFYLVGGLTIGVGLLAPLAATVSWIIRGRPSEPPDQTDALPPARPRRR